MVPSVIYLYARISTDQQSEASITDQVRRCRDYATARGWTIADEFTEEAVSGAAIGNRPKLQAALARLSHGDVLLVADLSRLSRSQDLAPLAERLRFRGVRVIGVLDGFDSDSPQARMQAGLSGIMSDELRASIRVRVHSALDLRAMQGTATGGKCYGFTTKGEQIPEQIEIVLEVFRRYADGESLKGIASDLNRRGVPSAGADWDRKTRRTDGRWIISALHAMLRNERYAGQVIWNRSQWIKDPDSGKRIRRERPRSEWRLREIPAVVSPELWARVQSRAVERGGTGSGPGGQPKYLLSGLLLCEHCGGRMIVSGAKGSHYYCATHRQGGMHACPMSVGVRRDVAEQVLLAPVIDDLLGDEAVELATQMIRQWARQERTRVLSGPAPEIADIEARIGRLQAQVEAGVLDAADVAPSIDALQVKRENVLRAAWRHATTIRDTVEVPAERLYRDAAAAFRGRLTGKGLIAAREALRELIEPVTVRPHESGEYLVAKVGLNATPLLMAAGIASSGSGGLLWPQAKLILALHKAA